MSSIRSVAVIGAGTMGAQIAAHFANAGIRSVLADLTNHDAREGLRRAQRLKPDPFFTPQTVRLIETAGVDRDLARIAEADWMIEAVIEQMEAKRALLGRLDAVRKPGTIVSSNTSGIPIAALSAGLSDDFRRHWLGTHFFNPPRYLHLVEVIPTPETDRAVVERVSRFAADTLGKGVVVANDTPNFIANRIGLFGMVRMLRALETSDYTIEEIDAITGPAIGRPKSASFRTADLAGLDILGHVARNLAERLPDARAEFALPAIVDALIERGWIGEKAGQGFYKKVASRSPAASAGAGGEAQILTLDPASLSYRTRVPARLSSLDAVRSVEDVGSRIKALFHGPDRVGAFLRSTLGATLVYAARVAPEISSSIDDVDRAMRWGFGWELGPFETWDAIGVREVLAAAPQGPVPSLADDVLRAGRNRFRDGSLPAQNPRLQILKAAKDRQRVVRANPGASLVDIGDGVLAVEFHSKMNAIGGDTLQMLNAGIQEATASFQALVVGNDAPHFSAGANLMLLLLEAQEANWAEIELMVRAFQGATQALRRAEVPVVSCPAGLAIGGGCEIVLHTDRVQAAAETYIGLVEAGVGLIPAGGGTKEMLARATESLPSGDADLLPAVQRVFETIGFAKVSTSAEHARELGYLRPVDGLTMNRERAMTDAKAVALERASRGYRPAPPRTSITVGGDDVRAALNLGVHLAWRAGRITDHEALVGRVLAGILSGGSLAHRTSVDEQYILDLEREAFLKLCGERKTLERIQHTLKTGKPLRN